jgi:NAD(P)-dependent dehydrogenase (short-subunit alcohol dehydrogenase family)
MRSADDQTDGRPVADSPRASRSRSRQPRATSCAAAAGPAEAIVFLATAAASFVRGAVLPVDGGRIAV